MGDYGPVNGESGSPIGVSREDAMNAAFCQRKLLFSNLVLAIAIGEPLLDRSRGPLRWVISA
jgi:hypothetical protein